MTWETSEVNLQKCESVLAEPPAVGRPGVVANPAECLEALAESFRDPGRQPGVRVVETSRKQVALPRAVEPEHTLEAIAWIARVRVREQIHLACEARE